MNRALADLVDWLAEIAVESRSHDGSPRAVESSSHAEPLGHSDVLRGDFATRSPAPARLSDSTIQATEN